MAKEKILYKYEVSWISPYSKKKQKQLFWDYKDAQRLQRILVNKGRKVTLKTL